MLDYFCIFARGGALLWTFQMTALKGSPVDELIRSCLLEERVGDKSYTYAPAQGGPPYTLKWTLHNGLGLVFVAVYQKALSLMYVDALLERIKQQFAIEYKPDVYDYRHFDDHFKRVLKECEMRSDMAKRPSEIRTADATVKKGGTQRNGSTAGFQKGQSTEESDDEDDGADKQLPASGLANGGAAGKDTAVENGTENGNGITSEDDSAFDISKLAKLKRGKGKKPVEKPKKKEPAAPKKKAPRVWNDHGQEKDLDRSEGPADLANGVALVVSQDARSGMFDEEPVEPVEDVPQNSSVLGSFMKSISVNVMGTNALTKEDIQKALDIMKRKLLERNVAEEIASKLCDSVAGSLEGQKLGSFTLVTTAVKQAFEEALVRILTPKRTINILSEVEKAKERGKPYVMVFVGVNGVGKSTNLAKVAYWLIQNNIKVMIAACDTFRAGAVEQLHTHSKRLQVPLYERGYEKDPAKVAFEATKQAERDGCDVLLVDTAGRMQDNEPLMRALSSLINMNHPDLVLFVGEALVGNDAVDQLTKFNQRLADLATGPQPHLIDGILLTKFDTIDDKVGAALSMVYTSGAPIMFVGCGQTYVDLKRLNVQSVVRSLLK